MAEISETKTPQPGEYWVSDDGSIIRIVGTKLNGSVIYENQAGFSFQFNSMIQWRHEPRCTGFDWVEPKLLTPGEGYELLPVGTVLECGDEFLIGKEWVMTGNYGEDYSVLRNTYRRKIKPVESPNDWVEITNRDHKLRAGIDEFRNSHEWAYVRDSHGKTARQAGFLNVRCRRKDLPNVRRIDTDGRDVTAENGLHDESNRIVKRAPLRLWVHREAALNDRCNVFAKTTEPDNRDLYLEILLDDDGFYVENPSG